MSTETTPNKKNLTEGVVNITLSKRVGGQSQLPRPEGAELVRGKQAEC